MKSNAKFNLAYKQLNPAQKKAVDSIEGPVMVIAGPGTGKTQILTLRIANILKKTDTSPDSILALTFTESAAFSMRKRLVDIIGPDAYRVNFFTFHSFANEIIKRYPEYFEEIIGARNITEADQITILTGILDDLVLELLKPYGDPHYYVRSALEAIRDLKREDVSPFDFKKLVEAQDREFKKIPDLYHEKGKYKGEMKGKWLSIQKSINKNFELAIIYSKYQEELRKKKFYDFEDMIMEVVRVLSKKKDLLLEIQEQYQYILADEHQDTNNAQNKLLELISSFYDSPNLFVVGDEKQAIFRFQGASLENFLYFKKRFPKAEVIFLKTNYRSGQGIIDASQSVIKKDNDKEASKYRIDLEAHKNISAKVCFLRFDTAEEQNLYIANEIKEKIESGVDPREIAVLYRDNRDADPVSSALTEAGVSHRIESNLNILDNDQIWKIIIILRAIDDLSNDENLVKLLFLDLFGISTFDVEKLIKASRERKVSLFKLMFDSDSKTDLIDSPLIFSLALKLDHLAKVARNKHLIECLTEVINEIGLLKVVMERGQEALSIVERFFEAAKDISNSRFDYRLRDFVSHVELLEKYNLAIKGKEDFLLNPAVRLMTAHRSKGLEFEYVYIVDLNDGHWGNRRETQKFKLPLYKSVEIDPNKDERKLFYVALTRAKKECILTSYSLTGESKNLLPSIFIDEIDSKFLEEQKINRSFNRTNEYLKKKESRQTTSIKDSGYIRNLFNDRGLSVSAVNNYLECPSKYFFESLIRIPKSSTRTQHYGTAMHETLSEIQDRINKNSKVNKKNALNIFEKHLERKLLSEQDFRELSKKGVNSLASFYDKKITYWRPHQAETEMGINGVFIGEGEEKVLLRGRLDRVEFVGNNKVIITDFKTSKPKTRNQILGKTKDSDGNIYRQLVFYNILMRGYANGKYSMAGGNITFTEPDDKGNIKEEYFEIREAEAKDLESQIIQIAREVRSLDFLNKRCDDKKCTYCMMMDYSSISDSTKDRSSK